MRINNNIMALNSHRQYGINSGNIGKNVEKLSSGYRVNRSADDAAGLAISEKMRAQIRGLNMASKNSLDAISLVQTAEGALQTSHDILQKMRELAVQASTDTYQLEVDREALNAEFQQLIAEINDTADKTSFNNMGLIDGNFDPENGNKPLTGDLTGPGLILGTTFVVQSGANMGDELKITIKRMDWITISKDAVESLTTSGKWDWEDIGDISDGQIKVNHGTDIITDAGGNEVSRGNPQQVDLHTQKNASAAISIVNAALNVVSSQRSDLGALQNRLEFKIQNLDISAENLQAAESRIRDADMAKMMTKFTRDNILFQSSTAMLAQANALPQGVLQLLN